MMQKTLMPTKSLLAISKPSHKKEPSLQDKQDCWLEWQRSGLSKSNFCRQRRMSTATFYRWTKELGQISTAVTQPALIPATVVSPSSEDKNEVWSAAHESIVDIGLPNGIHLRAPLGSDLTVLTAFIKEISHVSPTNTLS